MKNYIAKDRKIRQITKNYEIQRLVLKAIAHDQTARLDIRRECSEQLHSLPRKSSFTTVTNRCILTGRSRGVHSRYKLARFPFKKCIESGLVSGVSNLSW